MILCECCTHLFDHFTGDGVSISVDGTLCYHYDVEPLAGNVTRRLELGAQMLWPAAARSMYAGTFSLLSAVLLA